MSTFAYVKIPADSTEAIEELKASKEGGLEQDALVKSAKSYFQQQANGDHPSCEIMALSVPLPGNNFRAASLYTGDYGHDNRENARATKLVTACGHSLPQPIRGDVFVGRAHDNEAFEWDRDDFPVSDADPTAEWCRIARSSGGGGGKGGSASSLSGLVSQSMNIGSGAGAASGKAPPHIIAPPPTSSLMYGMDGSPPVKESWGTWTQSADEVELKLTVPAGTSSKDCRITFKRSQLGVAVNKETQLEGALFSAIVPDECTYTMEDVSGARELCVTLAKADEGATWSWLTANKE
jgi:hypothetical protein